MTFSHTAMDCAARCAPPQQRILWATGRISPSAELVHDLALLTSSVPPPKGLNSISLVPRTPSACGGGACPERSRRGLGYLVVVPRAGLVRRSHEIRCEPRLLENNVNRATRLLKLSLAATESGSKPLHARNVRRMPLHRTSNSGEHRRQIFLRSFDCNEIELLVE